MKKIHDGYYVLIPYSDKTRGISPIITPRCGSLI